MKFMQKLRKSAKGKKGFTLIELIIVIAIIAILIALIAPNMVKFLGSAKSTSLQANAKTAYTSLQTLLTEKTTAGITIKDGTYTITVNATTKKFVVAGPTGTGIIAITPDDLDGFFNVEEVKSATIVAKVGTANAVETVNWADGDEDADYPKK